MRPADECPYARPFRSDFHDCEAFQPVRFIPLSSEYRPLAPATTCRHLVSRRVAMEPGRWYGACVLGNASARRAWVDHVSPARLEAISVLRREMAGLNATYIDQLWRLKGRQLEARQRHGDDGPTTREMRDVGEQFIAQSAEFLEAHTAVLAEIDVTLDAILYLLRSSIDHLIQHSSGEVRWEIPEEALAQFSPQVRLFFRPPSIESRAGAAIE